MENEEFALEYFCRLCASEGVVIHPLFPPGDDDPKDELIRMIEVLTSVGLTKSSDASAVICDKCLQMLDLFCQFREECLRQDVLIRTNRTLLKEELERQRRQDLLAEQLRLQQTLQETVQSSVVSSPAPPPPLSMVTVKLEEEEDDLVDDDVQEVQTQPPPAVVVIDDVKDEECDGGQHPTVVETTCPLVQPKEEHDADDEFVLESSPIGKTFLTPEIALFPQPNGLSISVQVNQISLTGTGAGAVDICTNTTMPPTAAAMVTPPTNTTTITTTTSNTTTTTTFRKGKPDRSKPPPDCDICQEAFATHYDYEQHMDTQHTWDKGNRCSLACDPCQMRFTKSYNLKRHMYEVHGELAPGLTVTACEHCGEKFLRGYILNRHIAKTHRVKRKSKIASIRTK